MNKKIVWAIVVAGLYLGISAKCIRKEHKYEKEMPLEEDKVKTKLYDCKVKSKDAQAKKSAFDQWDMCLYCGCHISDHDNE